MLCTESLLSSKGFHSLAVAHAKEVSIFLLIFHLAGERHKDNLHHLSKCCSIFSKGSIIWKISQPYCIYYISSRSSAMNSFVQKLIWNLELSKKCCNHQNIGILWSIWKQPCFSLLVWWIAPVLSQLAIQANTMCLRSIHVHLKALTLSIQMNFSKSCSGLGSPLGQLQLRSIGFCSMQPASGPSAFCSL